MNRPHVHGRPARYDRRTALRFGALGALGAAGGLAALSTAGCAATAGGPTDRVTIASGYGISYAPLTVIQERKWLEEALPDRTVNWTVLSGGSASRDAMLSGEVQFGTSGLGPFLISRDAGIPWKVVSGLNDMPLWLVATEERLQSLEDFGSDDKIAAVQPGSIQSVMLQRAAQEELGDPHALDDNIVSMDHPSALQALLSGQIAGQYTSPPFQFQAVEQGARKLVDSYDLFGRHGFNVVTATEEYAEAQPEVLEAFHEAIARANELITDDPSQVADILSRADDDQTSPEEYERYLTWEGIEYTTTPHSLVEVGSFMASIDVIETEPTDWRALVFDTVADEDGS
ncbi:hypothetical protein BJF85_00810 [Saccharomonospora sp. CUA-673]|uniref:ABC transporter substrate-binding protein n=1 Tax=Saccharomonospora sp. CUA-673 TaxID=1904969 RepID=UPI000959F071|nr:ABC transporter substrate-binding protein [Saccharomonospora sp. CUA-673]OLT47010.1 hypothetical protein BJF85_00810 [Saccharomonospora sp. CUA-673]